MNMNFEQKPTEDGVEIKVTAHIPKSQIVITDWPKFTISWMGIRTEGRMLSPGVYQIGSAVVFRNVEGEYVELVPKVYAKWLEDK